MNGRPNPVRRICEIPKIEGNCHLGRPYKTRTYVLILKFEQFDDNRYSMWSTDFTSNVQIDSELGEDEKEFTVLKTDDNKVLRIVVYDDKVRDILETYNQAHPSYALQVPERGSTRNEMQVDDKLMIFGMTLSWREYRGIFEPWAYDLEIVEWEYLDDAGRKAVSSLYKNILKKKHYIKALDPKLVKDVISEEFLRTVSVNDDDDDDDELSEMSLYEDDLVDQSITHVTQAQARQNVIIDDVVYSIEQDLTQDQIGNVNTTQEMGHKRINSVPDFNDGGAKRSKQGSSSSDENNFYDAQTQNKGVVRTSNASSTSDNASGVFTTICELNKLDQHTIDNKTYNVVCDILHASPCDKEWFSFKSYEVNPLTEDLELSHTQLQTIEFIITDPAKPDNYELDQGEYLSIYLDGPQVVKLNKASCVTRKLLNFAWDKTHDDSILRLKLRKVQRETVVWTVEW